MAARSMMGLGPETVKPAPCEVVEGLSLKLRLAAAG